VLRLNPYKRRLPSDVTFVDVLRYMCWKFSVRYNMYLSTVQPARNLHKPSDPSDHYYPRAVKHRGPTPVDPGGHDPRVSRRSNAMIRGGCPRGIIAVNGFSSSTL